MSAQVVVIAPHPDDEILGCGGAIARHAAEGDSVHVVIVSRGVPEIFPFEEIERTRAELALAHREVGVAAAHFLDFPAPRLASVPNHEIADRLSRLLREIDPAIVYAPHWGDVHSDHRATYWATAVAARPCSGARLSRLLCYETLSETEWAGPVSSDAFIPTVFVDITGFLAVKLSAMSRYASQLRPQPHPRSLRAVESLARVRGSAAGFEAAEAFALVRERI